MTEEDLDLPFPLFTCCKFIINDKIPNKDGKLFKIFTNTLEFKISSIDPLVIEKDWPSQEDIVKLIEALKKLLVCNSKNCDLEDNHGETFELRTTKENIKSGDLVLQTTKEITKSGDLVLITTKENTKSGDAVQIPLQQAPEVDKQLRKHTGEKCADAGNTDVQAVGSIDVKHDLTICQGLKANDVSTDQGCVSEIKCAENVSSGNTTFEEIDTVSVESRVNDKLQIQENATEAEKQTQDNQVLILGSKVAGEPGNRRPPSLLLNLNQTHLPLEDIDRKAENTATRLLKDSHDAWRNKEIRETADNKTTYKTSKAQKPKYNDMVSTELQSHGVGFSYSLLPEGCRVHKHNTDKGTYSGASGCSLVSNDHGIYHISERSKMKVQIFNADITKLQVDCVVNATNKRLLFAGGVSKALSLAAGPAVRKECEDFTHSGNQVAVTDIFMSTGGKMPAKYVMHTVGPKWDNYDDQRKSQCYEDLRHTVLRCLVEAGRHGFTSIALPSISAAIFKVPKEECARCYMEAVKHYDIFIEEQTSSLHDINFVDVDDSMVKIIKEHFQKNWAKPCDPYIVQKDCEFAKTHLHSTSKNPAKNFQRSPNTSKLPSSAATTKTPGTSKSSSIMRNWLLVSNKVPSSSELRTERSSVYQIGKFTLRTDSRPAFNHSVDITITVGKLFDKLSSIRDFSVSSNKEEKQSVKNTYKLFNVSKPKSKQQQRPVCALLPEPDNTDNIKEAFENLGKVIQSPNHNIFMQTTTNVVITSSILYEEPDNKQIKENKQVCDRKKVGNFAVCLFDYFDQASKKTGPKMSIIVVGSEDALQCIHKVMESRGVSKISPEANPSSHQGASGMTSTIRENSYYLQTTKHTGNYPKDKQNAYEGVGTFLDLESSCEICYEKNVFTPVSCCNKNICNNCVMKLSSCPFCRKFWRFLTGDQPPGTMSVSLINDHADGYEGVPAWEIKYKFPGGLQMEHHPNPGKRYDPIERRAYLPATDAGLQVLILLRVAFLRKLIFTIGRSLTTDRESSLVWNDILHKKRLHGGTYGYPDSNYLHRVTSELANKGVVFDTFTQSERYDIERLHENLLKLGCFYDV